MRLTFAVLTCAVVTLAGTLIASPAMASDPAAIPVKPRPAAESTLKPKAASDQVTLGADDDCASVKAKARSYLARGIKTAGCLSTSPKPLADEAEPATLWCQSLGELGWYVRRDGACSAYRNMYYSLYNLDTGEVIGTAWMVISQQIDLPRAASTSFTEQVEVTMVQTTGAVPGLYLMLYGYCSAPCLVESNGRAWAPLPVIVTQGQTVRGSVTYHTDPVADGIPATVTTNYRFWVHQEYTIPIENEAYWLGPGSIRCDAHVGVSRGCVMPEVVPRLPLFLSVHREAAANILFAQYALPDAWGADWLGGPPLHRLADDAAVQRNRDRICDRTFVRLPSDVVANDSCDEYSFARSYESGGMLGLTGVDCAEVVPFEDAGEWYVSPIRLVGDERCIRGHVPLDKNRLVGSELGVFTLYNRLLDGDAYYVDVFA